jgi:hypothetical protein
MQKFKQRLFLKKVEKLLNKPAPQAEIYDTTMHTMYVGATGPRTAGHFADSAVSVKLGQVKRIVEMVDGVLEVLLVDEEANGEDVEARFMELEVRFQEMDLGLLFTQQEEAERRIVVARRRRERVKVVAESQTDVERERRHVVSRADLEGMRSQIRLWQKEQLERKRRLYKIETTVRDLGVNINDVRCRGLDRDRRVALASLNMSTDSGIRILREIVEVLGRSVDYTEGSSG